MQKPLIHILLATYNGGKFLRVQLDSLFAQSLQDFRIVVRDDGSADDTLQIIAEYQQRYPGRIELITDHKKNLGATQNFGMLLQYSTADYIFFCDQDDQWLPDKLETTLKVLKTLEVSAPGTPCMVFSDMQLMDENGKITHASAWANLHLSPAYFTLNRMLVQNIPHGCTMLINKAMRDLAVPLPAEALLHDHWIALLAACCGKWKAVTKPTMLLRNHAQNVTRQQTTLASKLKRFTSNFFSGEEYEHYIRIRTAQANALLQRCGPLLNADQKTLLQDFISMENCKGLARKRLFLKHHFYRSTFFHTAKMILRA